MKKNIIPLILIVTFFIIMYFFDKYRADSLKNNYKFTVAKITSDFHYKNGNGTGCDFIYYIENREYTGAVDTRNVIKGKCYLIAYDSSGKTNRTQFFENIIIPKNINIPLEGWSLKGIPFKVDTISIKKKIEELQ